MRAVDMYATGLMAAPLESAKLRRGAPEHARLSPGPSAPRRWARQLRAAVPTSFGVFRGVLRTPVRGTRPKVGSPVVARGGGPVGPIQDVLVGVGSGKLMFTIRDERTGTSRGLLVPANALATGDGKVVLIDERHASVIAPATVLAAQLFQSAAGHRSPFRWSTEADSPSTSSELDERMIRMASWFLAPWREA